MDTTELIGILEPFKVLLVHHRKSSREKLAENIVQTVMLDVHSIEKRLRQWNKSRLTMVFSL